MQFLAATQGIDPSVSPDDGINGGAAGLRGVNGRGDGMKALAEGF